MQARHLACLAVPAVIALAVPVASRSSGIYNPAITRMAPSCGLCHNPSPGAGSGFAPIAFAITPSQRVLDGGQSITVDAAATGGQTSSDLGGFAIDATAGTFSAGTDTRTQASGAAITHSRSTPGRAWTFGYTAPVAPGLVELHGVVNTVNGDFINDFDDLWAFHGADQTATSSTPVRLFVNAAGVQAVGTGCAGSFGNFPVLGASEVPTAGNANFAVQLHGAAPASAFVVVLGSALGQPFDLGLLGITGCQLYVDPAVLITGTTTSGSPERGEGSATVALPLPVAVFPGQSIQVQALVVDGQNGRATPVTASNALAVVIQ